MNNQYVVNIYNVAENKSREISVSGTTPMHAHKTAYMGTKKEEEVRTMLDDDGNVVFDIKKGFKKAY
jgi:hypothetical protein